MELHTSEYHLGLMYGLLLWPPFPHGDYIRVISLLLNPMCVLIVLLACSCLVTLWQLWKHFISPTLHFHLRMSVHSYGLLFVPKTFTKGLTRLCYTSPRKRALLLQTPPTWQIRATWNMYTKATTKKKNELISPQPTLCEVHKMNA
jgi:hypothetical protein